VRICCSKLDNDATCLVSFVYLLYITLFAVFSKMSIGGSACAVHWHLQVLSVRTVRVCKSVLFTECRSSAKIVNRKYDVNPELFFQLDVGDRRGHDQKLLKKRFRLNVRKCSFSNRVTDNSCLLPCLPVALIVALLTLSRNTCRLNLNRKILYGESLCLLMPASSVEACWRR